MVTNRNFHQKKTFCSKNKIFAKIQIFAVGQKSNLMILGYETASDQEDLNRIERQIKRRFLIGSQVSEKSIVSDLIKQNYPERSVSKVLQIMIRRGEVQHRMQRRMLYRVK